MKNQSSNHYCQNCYAPLKQHAAFCPKCGQKRATKYVTFWQLISEGFSSLFNLDSRIFKTIFALFIPGKLTTEYFKGRQQSYVPPVRILLFSTVVLIALISFALGEEQLGSNLDSEYSKLYGNYEKGLLITKLDTLKLDAAKRFDNPSLAKAAIDTLLQLANVEEMKQDSFSIGYEDNGIEIGGFKAKIAKKDLLLLSEDEIIKQYNVQGFWQQLLWKQGIHIFRKGDQLIPYLIGNLLWLVIVMLLLLGGVLKLFYARRSRYYVEHLVFSMHTHAFMFTLFGLQLAFFDYLSSGIFFLSLAAIAVYVLFALKKYYGQSWRKTIFKFTLIHFIYFFLLSMSLFLTFLVSVGLF